MTHGEMHGLNKNRQIFHSSEGRGGKIPDLGTDCLVCVCVCVCWVPQQIERDSPIAQIEVRLNWHNPQAEEIHQGGGREAQRLALATE